MALQVHPMIIDGLATAESQILDVVNPATGRAFAAAPVCTAETLDRAVAAARRAQPAWSAVPFADRRALVAGLAGILEANLDGLMRLLTEEQGKPHEEAKGEILGAAYWFRAAADFELPTEVLEDSADRLSVTRRVPLGVIGAILPWNFPVLVFAFKVIPALLAGNTVVAKPSPFTPLTTLKVGHLFQAALPPGVLNVVSGADEVGAWMSAHPGIDKIGFTGSTATGKKIIRSAAETVKRISLELGGNDPAIVMPDVDIERTAQSVFWGAFGNAGQICVATKRAYVHAEIFEPFLAAMIDYARGVNIGDGAAQGTQIGPIQNKAQFARVQGLIDDCREQGYRLHQIGECPAEGYFSPLNFVEDPPETARIVVEEQFGPILPVLRFRDLDEVIGRANAGPYGLAASVWSKDAELGEAIAARLDCGNVWINTVQDSPLTAPIAGHKQSGLGAENGLPGLLEYTNLRTITTKRSRGAIASAA